MLQLFYLHVVERDQGNYSVLDTRDGWINEIPLVLQAQRFGAAPFVLGWIDWPK